LFQVINERRQEEKRCNATIFDVINISPISSLSVSKWTAPTPPASIRLIRGEIPAAPQAGGLLMGEIETGKRRENASATTSLLS
jgi:hypothetical protein